MPEQGWGPLREALAADVRRVSDRLRSLSAARLAAPISPGGASRAEAARGLAQELADAAGELEGRTGPEPPRLPALADFAAGDQVAVTGHDLLAAMDRTGPGRGGTELVERVSARLAELRRQL